MKREYVNRAEASFWRVPGSVMERGGKRGATPLWERGYRSCSPRDRDAGHRFPFSAIGNRPLTSQAFTLIELLVTITIIGVLAGLLLPALGHAKLRAQQVKCLSNIKQLSLASFMYASDQNKYAGYNNRYPGGAWMGALMAYAQEKDLRVCPTAPLHQPPPSDGNGQGYADRAWVRWTWDKKEMLYGSYGYNGWLYSDITFTPDSPRSKEQGFFYTGEPSIQQPALTPVFVDANWVDLWPLETDTPYPDLYVGRRLAEPHNDMGRCMIARHGGANPRSAPRHLAPLERPPGAVNIGLADGHVEIVKLENLWNYSWHLDWKTPAMRWK